MKAAIAILLAACWTRSSAPAPITNTGGAPASSVMTKEQLCERLLAHIVDLELAKAGADPAAFASLREQVMAAKSVELTHACVDRTPRERIECALVAADLDALERCDSPAP
jgi:hypothetical protein